MASDRMDEVSAAKPQVTTEALCAHPQLAALMPLLYIVWADGELQQEEREALLRGPAQHLGESEKSTLQSWLDPAAPPSATEMLRLYEHICAASARLGAATRASLVDLGLDLLRANSAGTGDAEATGRALAEVEDALGLHGADLARRLFRPRPPVLTHFAEAPPPFAIADLTEVLDGPYRQDWQWVREQLQRGCFRYRYDLGKERYREQVKEWLLELAQAGVGQLSLPTQYGGTGRVDRFIKVFEALGMFDLSLVVKVGVQFGLFGGAIANLGTSSHHQRYLAAIGRAELLGGFAMTELGHGSNVRELETVARYDAERAFFVLHSPSVSARKEWIGNAAVHGRMMVVFAQLETLGVNHGVHAFVVPVRDEEGRLLPGVYIEDCGHKMGLNGVDNGRIRFDHVEVPRENLLDRYASVEVSGRYSSPIADPGKRFFTMLGTLVAGRISVASAAVTASKSALAIAVRYGALRRQFGPAGGDERCVLDYLSHQQRLLPQLATTYALHFAVQELQQDYRKHLEQSAVALPETTALSEADARTHTQRSKRLEAHAAGLKALASWHAIAAAQASRECCGGMGFLTINRICQIRKDIDVFATFEGDNTVLLQLLAKSLLTDYAEEFQSDLVGTLLRELGRSAVANLNEANPINARRIDSEHLRDLDFHRAALRFRAEHLCQSAARRLKKRLDDKIEPFVAFNEVQDHLLALATAHMECAIYGAFHDAVNALAEQAKVAPALVHNFRTLCALHGVARLYTRRAWFLENGYIESRKARALRKELASLCTELRPLAVALVDAFGIPEQALAAPIAFENYPDGLSSLPAQSV